MSYPLYRAGLFYFISIFFLLLSILSLIVDAWSYSRWFSNRLKNVILMTFAIIRSVKCSMRALKFEGFIEGDYDDWSENNDLSIDIYRSASIRYHTYCHSFRCALLLSFVSSRIFQLQSVQRFNGKLG